TDVGDEVGEQGRAAYPEPRPMPADPQKASYLASRPTESEVAPSAARHALPCSQASRPREGGRGGGRDEELTVTRPPRTAARPGGRVTWRAAIGSARNMRAGTSSHRCGGRSGAPAGSRTRADARRDSRANTRLKARNGRRPWGHRGVRPRPVRGYDRWRARTLSMVSASSARLSGR